MKRVFVLSPADCNGLRARWVLKKTSRSELAQRLRAGGAPLGEVFSFLSALYFRGKLAYALAFAAPPSGCPGVWLITPTAGLVPHDRVIRLAGLRGYSRGRIHVKNKPYCTALRRSAKKLAAQTGEDCEIVLLGSLATGKYLDILATDFRQAAARSGRIHRPRRHEPRRLAAALRAGSEGAELYGSRRALRAAAEATPLKATGSRRPDRSPTDFGRLPLMSQRSGAVDGKDFRVRCRRTQALEGIHEGLCGVPERHQHARVAVVRRPGRR